MHKIQNYKIEIKNDGHVRTKTCSLTHNKTWCAWW